MSDEDFHTTLERLRDARDELERDFDRRLEMLDGRVGAARTALEAAAEEAGQRSGVSREHVEAVRELAGRTAEAVEAMAGAVRRLRDVLNAKEAETVHVATHGARAQAELTLEELARQQEALLAELVGRRADLDALLASAARDRAPPDEQG